MRTAVGHHQLHRHRDVQGVVARREGVAGVGVPQPVRTVRQPRTRGTSTQAEEARVGSHLRPLQPPRRTATDRLPPPRRQITPQGHATGRKHLHRAVPRDDDRHPLGHHPPAAVLVRLQHRPGIGLRTVAYQRVRRLGLRPVPAPEDSPVHGDENPQLRPAEPDDTAPGPGSAACTGPGTRARSAPRDGSPVASARRLRHAARTVRTPCAAPTEPTAFTERTRSRPFMLLTLPLTAPHARSVQLPFTCVRTTSSRGGLCGTHPGAEVDHVALSVPAASRAHPSPCAEDAHDAHSPGADDVDR